MQDHDQPYPGLFIAGFPKAGTTALANLMARSPEICMPLKEPRFFASSMDPSVFFTGVVEDESDYLALFGSCGSRLRLDASPIYSVAVDAPARMAEAAPEASVVLMLRDPVERAYSHFLFRERRTGRSTRTVAEVLEASKAAGPEDYESGYLLRGSQYVAALDRFVTAFGRERVEVLVFEEFVRDPASIGSALFDRLGLAPLKDWELATRERNPASRPRGQLAAKVMQSPALRRGAQTTLGARRAYSAGKRWLTVPSDKEPMASGDREALTDALGGEAEAAEAWLGRSLPWPSLS